ncbi:hypothetical protein ACJ2A9_03875 [Anaerobacillus sp. MEB173]|uniref:hypothetical protein n=1 Tax=Anaerobacillus sp. MEB173 TaxID=3383345 RepID=UPI003F92EF57
MKYDKLDFLKKKIKQLNQETASYLKEIKDLLPQINQTHEMNVISYFTYSFSISHEKEKDSLIIATYHLHNLGTTPITNPYICLKLAPESPFSLSGKYIHKNSNLSIRTPEAWQRINDQSNKDEYWLKPIGIQIVEPSQIISFSNFQLTWLPTKSYSGSVMGFSYCDEYGKGIPAINQINVSGT